MGGLQKVEPEVRQRGSRHVGEAKCKQYSREQFLREHPTCCYCGLPATTTDHCPPRAMFLDRIWPEGYEFPACHTCNQEARKDEQVLAMLGPLWFTKNQTKAETEHWKRHAKGLANNQPEIIAEMLSGRSRNEQHQAFRQILGNEVGDELRRRGYGIGELGPRIQAVISRFATKLAKALFYKHAGTVLDGELWAIHFTAADREKAIGVVELMLTIAPLQSETSRSGQVLNDQFTYRYNCSAGPEPVLYAVVQFNDQLMFNIVAASNLFREAVGGSMGVLDEQAMSDWRVDARLSH